MAIKVQFEIGHSATVKSKRTPDGFTHDWELYVQGVNKADISAFVDKVVFNLHDSFPKPKRSFKEPPYVLKESGYAGFVLPIDIYFRNRDEPKRVTFSYDLDLQQEGPPVHRSEVKKYIFEAPSDDFRQKLLKGGGIAVSGVVGGAITADEKSLDMSVSDNRSQMIGKPKLSSDANSTSSSSSSKKHKQRPDDSKSNTFANLFGPPITKSAPKFSPDPKAKTANGGAGAPMAAGAAVNSKSVGGKDKANSSNSNAAGGNTSTGPTVVGVKEKDKSDKKEKHKQQTSPHKEKNHEEKESRKKSEGKHDKRDEKKKEKKDKEKDRERNKEKPSKRSLSPKSAAAVAPSPKRSSPVRSSSAASRDDPSTTVKASSKFSESEKRNSGSSGGKKSKKEKKSHDKDRDHKERHRVEAKESISVTNAVPLVPTQAAPPAQAPVSSSSKAQNPTVNTKTDLNSNKNQKTSEKESKKSDSTSKAGDKEGTPLTNEKKIASDKDKKSHKHKKKDKNKEKEKEKDKDQPSRKSTGSKDKKDKKEKTAKNEPATAANTGASKKSVSTEAIVDTQVEGGSTKSASSSSSSKPSKHNNTTSTVPTTNNSNSNNSNNMGTTSASGLLNVINDLSDVDSLNSESLHATSNSNSEKTTVMQNSDSSNSSFPELPTAQQQPKSTSLFQAPANPQPTPPLTSTPSSASSSLSSTTTIHETSRSVSAAEKKDHKQNRGADKSKAEKAAEKEDKKRRRNSTAVNTFVEPPLKQIKKDFNTKTAREKSQSPLLRTEDKQTFLPPPATTSTLSAQNPPVTALNLEYISELQELHQKIMTLQDNEELQQVVEMIAATGRYEITSKTFDFDLCKLDRNTVQRLQDFFATSVS